MQVKLNPDCEALNRGAAIWTVRPHRLDPARLQRTCLHWLDDFERASHESLGTALLRHEYLAAHAMCRIVLARLSGVGAAELLFRRGRFGKPRVIGPASSRALHFNLSHTRDFAACIVSRRGPVGIDVERTDRLVDNEQVARHFLSPTARQALAQQAPSTRQAWFYRQWVLREALLKARGLGLAGAMDAEPILLDADGCATVAGRWRVSLFELGPALAMGAAIRCQAGEACSVEVEGSVEQVLSTA